MATSPPLELTVSEESELFHALARIESRQQDHGDRLEAIETHLRTLNGSVKRHEQELYGADGHSGLKRDVARLWKRAEEALRHVHASQGASGTVPVRTMWTALTAVAAVASVIVAIVAVL